MMLYVILFLACMILVMLGMVLGGMIIFKEQEKRVVGWRNQALVYLKEITRLVRLLNDAEYRK